jgi:Na+-transporting NADH:ubiquinone oxidoreductase subunit A
VTVNAQFSQIIRICPDDFKGLIPKLDVKQGDEVKAGSILFHSKDNENIRIPSPVSGEIVEVERGDKRKILSVKILADKEVRYQDFKSADISKLNRDEVVSKLVESGAWSLIRQRPYSTIANPADQPKSIFVSGFDTAPLGVDYDYVVHGKGEEFQAGLSALKKLSKGKVHLNLNQNTKASGVFTNSKEVQINYFAGPHPAGNVGIQIHHIDPLNKGETVWYVNAQDVLAIGKLFLTGKLDLSKLVAVCGSAAPAKKYFKTIIGSSISSITGLSTDDKDTRIISGNVLTGKKVHVSDSVGYYDNQITIIPEGNRPEFLGWLAPRFHKFSASRAYFSWLMPSKKYNLNTNNNGEERAFVLSGEYEKVLPMDIYPTYLLKSILTNDIEKMEKLGIYEVDPEDFALCEFVCTSKMPVQQIISEGLETIRKENS